MESHGKDLKKNPNENENENNSTSADLALVRGLDECFRSGCENIKVLMSSLNSKIT